MKNILLCGNFHFLSHTTRLLEIGKALRMHEADVVFAGGGQFLGLARQAGFATKDLYTETKALTITLAQGRVNENNWHHVVRSSIADDNLLLHSYRPDVIVGDMRWSLAVSARYNNIPYVSVMNAHLTPYFSAPLDQVDAHAKRDLAGVALAMPYSQVAKELGVRGNFHNLFSFICGDRTLLCDLPQFMPTTNLPQTMQYIGPILCDVEAPKPPWLETLNKGQRTVYVTLGSSADIEFFEQAVLELVDAGFQVLVTTGGVQMDLPSYQNLFVTDFASGLLLMSHSNAVVHHGGNGTIYQAIATVTPMVGIPTHAEQEVNMQRVRDTGIGIHVPQQWGVCGVVEAVDEILNSTRYYNNVVELNYRLNNYRAAESAALEILRLC